MQSAVILSSVAYQKVVSDIIVDTSFQICFFQPSPGIDFINWWGMSHDHMICFIFVTAMTILAEPSDLKMAGG